MLSYSFFVIITLVIFFNFTSLKEEQGKHSNQATKGYTQSSAQIWSNSEINEGNGVISKVHSWIFIHIHYWKKYFVLHFHIIETFRQENA